MKQYYAQPTIRNNWERLHEVYPEARQMTYNNKGFDYIMVNKQGKNIRIEEKYRNKGNKYEITPAQEKIADIFTLRTWNGEYYHMLADTYHKLAKPHSALASGHREKITELSQKNFIENATTDLRSLIDEVEHDFGTLDEFLNVA
jgi:hypothetical protein